MPALVVSSICLLLEMFFAAAELSIISCDRIKLQDAVDKQITRLSEKIDRFSETELDQFILPHPLLGKLTLREMIYFTIYHVEHHHSQINPALRKSVA